MRVAIVGKLRKIKPFPMSPSPFRGGETSFDTLFASMSPPLGEMSRSDRGGFYAKFMTLAENAVPHGKERPLP